jgi:Acyl-CoA thioesterase C-terminal domain
MRFRDSRDLDLIGISCLVDAGAAAVMNIGASATTTVEITVHLRAKPATPWIACRAVTHYITGDYHEEDIELWDGTATWRGLPGVGIARDGRRHCLGWLSGRRCAAHLGPVANRD